MNDPLLDKMDALMKKHRGDAQAPAAAASQPAATASNAPPPLPDDAWLPVLTDVVAVGEPSAEPAPVPTVAAAPAPVQAPVQTPAPAAPTPAVDPNALVEQIMTELSPRLSAMLRDQLVVDVRDSLASLFAQMDPQIKEIVRKAVAEQLGKS